MNADLWLFAVVRPWVVALPVEGIERVLAADEAPAGLAVAPLARLLGLAAAPVGSIVLTSAGALGVDRCLQVGPLPPGGLTVPGVALRQAAAGGLRTFPLPPALDRPAADGSRSAPVGLVLDPARLGHRP